MGLEVHCMIVSLILKKLKHKQLFTTAVFCLSSSTRVSFGSNASQEGKTVVFSGSAQRLVDIAKQTLLLSCPLSFLHQMPIIVRGFLLFLT
jgi:hypothetical protein